MTEPEPEPGPVIAREPDALPVELPRGGEIPDDLDPFADGILMAHQAEWLADRSDLKICEKGRRTGITFAEALDDTLAAASARGEGGDNVFYIGDTKDKGREFVGYVAHFARVVAGELAQVEEFVFEDMAEDGTSRGISAYRVRFASGYRVEALSSRPENIRGLQGIVVIDEAAFHKDVRQVIDAVNALLIWGGKVRVISTHNGVLNPFNELVREARAKKNPFKVHFIPFQAAIENGLYRRVCLVKGLTWSAEDQTEWEARIRGSYGSRTAAMHQELDAIPAEAEGAALTRVQIEACMAPAPVIRWRRDDAFKNAPEAARKAEAHDFCERELAPILDRLDPDRPHYFGEDFARSGDVTSIMVIAQERTLIRRCPLLVEMRNVPFDQQREILFYIADQLPRFSGGALDATGNGAYLAEVAAQRYGGERIVEVKASALWYRTNGAAYVAAFTDGTMTLPRDEDVLADHQALQYIAGVIRVPENHRFKGADGLDRHGDSAIAGMMGWFASTMAAVEYGYQTAAAREDGPAGDDADDDARPWHRPPLGVRMRGSL